MIYLKAAAVLVAIFLTISLLTIGNVYLVNFLKAPDSLIVVLMALEMLAFGIYVLVLEELRKREKKRSQEAAR